MKDRAQRIEYLKHAVKSANEDTTHLNNLKINWRGKPLWKKVISVDIDYLMYRIENTRTEIQQLKYLREHPQLTKKLFEDPESKMAQDAQEEILLSMIKSKGKEFLDDLNLSGQDQPAIITYDGYIVNGNRRTAALKYLESRYIQCAVLPTDATPKDLYALEQEIQMSQDFKEEYHWINELRNIRRGLVDRRYSYRESEMAKRLRVSVQELKRKVRIIELIDLFLKWKKIGGQYDYIKLDDAEQIFTDLEKALRSKKYRLNNKNELMYGVFSLVENRPSEGRLYQHVQKFIRNFDQVYERVKSEIIPIEESPGDIDKTEVQGKDVIGAILEGEDEKEIEIFDKAENSLDVSKLIIEKTADVDAENKEKRDAEAVYHAVSTALRELNGLIIDNDTDKLESIENKLNEISGVVKKLLIEVKTQKDGDNN